MRIRLSPCIQHHPARAELLPALLEQLGGQVEVVTDPNPWVPLRSPWRTYRHALETTPKGATHRLVMQDDVEPCPGFLAAARKAVAARPGRLVVFFVAGNPRSHARLIQESCKHDLPWAPLRLGTWCPAVCNAWPVEMIEPFLQYVDSKRWPPGFCADDEIIGRFLTHTRTVALATVPSLVEHPDVAPSTLGKPVFAGLDAGRVAACMIPDEMDARRIDWKPGPA